MPTMEQSSPATARSPFVQQSRVIRAPRSRVYEAWTNSEILRTWFGPDGRYCPHASLDVRIGGAYRIDIVPTPDSVPPGETAGKGASAEGVYTEIVENEKLQFTWQPSFNPGEQSMVTVTFRDVPDGTEVTILHERVSAEGAPGYTKGWSGSLDKLAALLKLAA